MMYNMWCDLLRDIWCDNLTGGSMSVRRFVCCAGVHSSGTEPWDDHYYISLSSKPLVVVCMLIVLCCLLTAFDVYRYLKYIFVHLTLSSLLFHTRFATVVKRNSFTCCRSIFSLPCKSVSANFYHEYCMSYLLFLLFDVGYIILKITVYLLLLLLVLPSHKYPNSDHCHH